MAERWTKGVAAGAWVNLPLEARVGSPIKLREHLGATEIDPIRPIREDENPIHERVWAD